MGSSFLTLDSAVVGGGIAGLYAALELFRKKGASHKVALFESSARFGGRIETVEMDGFLAEFGPMRFEQKAQPLLMELIADMGLSTCSFSPYLPATDPDSLFDLAADENRLPGKEGGELYTALEILALGILRILDSSGGDLNSPRDARHWEWWGTLDEDFYQKIRTEFVFDGQPLFQTGFWNALSKVLSHRALQKIIQFGTFYHVVHYNPNAAEWIIFWLRGLHPEDELRGVKEGTEALVRKMVQYLSPGESPGISGGLHLNHHLISIERESENRVLLEFKTDEGVKKVVARHLVLAIPLSPLKYLSRFFPEGVTKSIFSVIPIPLVKCFYTTGNPWWDSSTKPQTRASSVPARELHYYYREEAGEKKGMVMVYGEPPSLNFWTPFTQNEPHLKAELNRDERLPEFYLKYLAPNPGGGPGEREAQLKALTGFGIRDWSREPFEAGCHIWKAGVDVNKSIEQLSAFPLHRAPESEKNIHICGEAYSDFQGFMEGALRTVKKVVSLID